MLTFREEFGELYARGVNDETIATGNAARNLYAGQKLFEKQLSRRSNGSLLNRKPFSILHKELPSWPLM